ncbi:MAG: hypothetical protein SFY56_05475 [Bacteroidota bacterium]|nr:hypothetical protein [Bacteroidota bacterium]
MKLTLENHPNKNYMSRFTDCGKNTCADKNILVDYCHLTVHPVSGDAYVDYKISCTLCLRSKKIAYSEN